MLHKARYLVIFTLVFSGATFAANAIYVGDVSNDMWDLNNWSTTDLTGTLTIGAGSPYDPVQKFAYTLHT